MKKTTILLSGLLALSAAFPSFSAVRYKAFYFSVAKSDLPAFCDRLSHNYATVTSNNETKLDSGHQPFYTDVIYASCLNEIQGVRHRDFNNKIHAILTPEDAISTCEGMYNESKALLPNIKSQKFKNDCQNSFSELGMVQL